MGTAMKWQRNWIIRFRPNWNQEIGCTATNESHKNPIKLHQMYYSRSPTDRQKLQSKILNQTIERIRFRSSFRQRIWMRYQKSKIRRNFSKQRTPKRETHPTVSAWNFIMFLINFSFCSSCPWFDCNKVNWKHRSLVNASM